MGLLRSFLFLAVLVSILAFAVGCASGPLIAAVGVAPERITPNGDRVDDVATISYTLTRPAHTSIYLLDASAQRYAIHENQPRPAGAYEAAFDGAVAASAAGVTRQVVPAGEYTYVVEAVDEAGHREERRGRLVVADPDRSPPSLEGFAAYPAEISPYDSRVDAETRLSYRLDKEATVTLYVEEPDGRRTRIAEPARLGPGEHSHTWDGLVRNKVPPAGEYTCLVQARDAAGNVVERSVSVAVSGTEEPDVSIVRVNFSPRQVMRGDVVKVEITVRNTGSIILRTHGPDPGYTYSTLDTFASIEDGRHVDQARMWRVGVDWAGGLGAEGARYPYRWGLGQDLAPGEETTVVGYIRVMEEHPHLRLFAGLIYEKVKYHVDRVGQQIIEVSY